MKSLENRRTVLENRLNELNTRLHIIEDELESHNARDWEELAVERETDEVLEGMGVSGQSEIRAIQAALARMDQGEYGACVSCGREISSERLDVLPFTPLCKTCAIERSDRA